jgi:DNA-binding NarL/FixJ family response regulator
LDRQLFNKIDPLLNRSSFSVEHMPRGESALELCRQATFDLILLGHPLPDMPLETFLRALRKEGALSARSQLLVLTDDVRLAELPESLQRGPDLALSVEQPQRLLEEVAARLLKVSPRMSVRLFLKLEVNFGDEKTLVIWQTENISETGMLVHTDRPYPIGTTVSFEFTPPNQPAPIRGEAEVVRDAAAGADVQSAHAVALLFTGLEGDGFKRLQAYIQGPRDER